MLRSPCDARRRSPRTPARLDPGRCAIGKRTWMRYLLAIVLPPLGMLSVGKPLLAILCLLLMLTLIAWPIASIWAVLVVNGAFADARARRALAASTHRR